MLLSRRHRFHKYQSSFRQNKSTDDHLFRPAQSVTECFNRGEHVLAAFLGVEKAFDNVWHSGLRYKIFMLDLPTKMTRWPSGFLVGRVIQVNVNGFLPTKSAPLQGYHRVLYRVHYFLSYTSMTYQNLTTDKIQNPSLLMTLLYGLLVKMYNLQQNFYK